MKNKEANKQLTLDILKTVAVLSIIAIIAGALLGVVNYFTQVDEMELLTKKISESGIYQGDGDLSPIEIGDGNKFVYHVFKYENTYVIHCGGDGGYKGEVQILMNITDGKIVNVQKYSSNETYTSKVFAEKFLTPFYNKDLTEVKSFIMVKDKADEDKEISAISGATKSSTAVLNAINNGISWYLSEGGTNE